MTVAPGTYVANGVLDIPAGVVVHGTPGARPRIETSAGTGVRLSSAPSALRDIDVWMGGTGTAVMATAGTLERVIAHSGDGTACETSDAVILNSICWVYYGNGLRAANQSPSATTIARHLTVAAVSSGDGIFADSEGTGDITVRASNTLAYASSYDVYASAGVEPQASATVELTYSNFDRTFETAIGGTSTVTDPGTPTNQVSEPFFVAPSSNDFHVSDFPVAAVDAGTASPVDGLASGTQDVYGAPRLQGAAPDIGAAEATPSPPFTRPSLTAPSKAKKKCRKGKVRKRSRCVKRKRKR